MTDYISRDDVLKAIDYQHEVNNVFESEAAYVQMWETINDDMGIKSADVQPVRHGRWIDIHEYCKMNGYIPSGVAVYYWCSECMKEEEKTSDFCPNCGARMDGEQK